jgi:hypothetical protein
MKSNSVLSALVPIMIAMVPVVSPAAFVPRDHHIFWNWFRQGFIPFATVFKIQTLAESSADPNNQEHCNGQPKGAPQEDEPPVNRACVHIGRLAELCVPMASNDAGQGQVSHQPQTGWHLQQTWHGIDQRRDCGRVAGDTAANHHIDGRVTFNLNCISRLGRIQIHLEVESQTEFAVAPGLGSLVQTAGLTLLDLQELCSNVVVSNYCITPFFHTLKPPTQAVG